MGGPVRVYLETGERRIFAVAVDWPGWARAHRSEEAALGALATYGHRYAAVAALAGERFLPDAGFDIVERVPGNGTTDFGAPAMPWSGDAGRPVSERELALLRAAWTHFDSVVAGAPAALRRGPRGGGRDRDKIASHVLEAEGAYAGKIGLRQRPPAFDDPGEVAAWRDAVVAALGGEGQWPPAYAARRIAWHALDHAWEIEDRS